MTANQLIQVYLEVLRETYLDPTTGEPKPGEEVQVALYRLRIQELKEDSDYEREG